MEQQENARKTPLEKIVTGINGLDEILEGGLPRGRTTLVNGGPGCGKSILGLEFLYRGALAGEPGILVAFEERADAVRANAATLGWNLAALEDDKLLFLMEAHLSPGTIISGEFTVQALLAVIEGKAREMGAQRVVFDAMDVLLRLFDDPVRERDEIYRLHYWLLASGLTGIITSKVPTGEWRSTRYEFLDFMADNVILLDQRMNEQTATRRLRVLKCRGSNFGRNEYPYVISSDGISVIPVSRVGLRHKALGEKISTGHARFDTILGGGIARASCILFSGQPGTGKTILASTYVQAACKRGERVLYIGFEESTEALIGNMLSPGIDLRPALNSGTLEFLTAIPESIGVEEHLLQLMERLDAFHPNHVVVDAISACVRMGGKQAASEYLIRVLDACKTRGVTVLLINQTSGRTDVTEISGNGISSLVDSVIRLSYIKLPGETNRTIEVMKSRGSKHSNQIREFCITDHGFEIVDVYTGGGEVLTGQARIDQEERDDIEVRYRLAKIEAMEHKLVSQREEMKAEKERIQKIAESDLAGLQVQIASTLVELESMRLELEMATKVMDARAVGRGEDSDSLLLQERVRKSLKSTTSGGAQ